MRESTLVFEPIVEIRDVLESFLVDEVLLTDWQGTLASASARLLELGHAWSDVELLELGRHVTELLAGERLVSDVAFARVAADNAARVLDTVHIPGFPGPRDDDWAF